MRLFCVATAGLIYAFTLSFTALAHDTTGEHGTEAAVAAPAAKAPSTLEDCMVMLSNTVMSRYDHLSQSWTLWDLINPDPAKSLAAQYPSIIMSNDQMDLYVANKFPRVKKKDPAYRRASYWYYPIINAGLVESNGHQLIGHYETIQRTMEHIEAKAKGKRATKMLGFVGPAGTGKTEILNLLDKARTFLNNVDPDYFQFTFEFTGLEQIEELKPLAYGLAGGEVSPAVKDLSLGHSPIVLLPRALQNKVTANATAAFREKMAAKGIQMDPLPFLEPIRKTQRGVDAIIAHYRKVEGKTEVTDKDYLTWLAKHVRIVRLVPDVNQPPQIIRYLGKHPDMTTLFFTENLAMMQYYGPKDPLSYNYGLIPSNNGRALLNDEFFRQVADYRDTTLDMAQNGIAQNGGAPPERLNITIYFATNDDSIAKANEDGSTKAHLDRTIRLPMRHAIEPWHVVKILINDIGRTRFKMRKIQAVPDVISENAVKEELEPEAALEPFDPQTVIPDVDSGELVGPDGRYALYYQPDSKDKPILVAPRALWMIGLVAAGTRIVTDVAAFQKANEKTVEFSTLAKFPQFFVDPKERLHVLNGTKQVPAVVAQELMKARDLLKEGQHGIGARNVENWFSEALALAKNTGAVTPVIVDMAFAKMLNTGNIEATPAERPKWIHLNNMVKAEFVLGALSADVLGILQGQGRAERMYDEVKMEIMALSADREAEHIHGEGNVRTPINRTRLNEIYQLFHDISGYQFDPGMLKDFHLQVSPESGTPRLPSLMEAVRRWLSQREIDKSTISELVEYFNGKPVSENIRAMGSQADRQLAAYGYDKSSFMQALLFVRDQQYEVDRQLAKPQAQ